MGGTGLRKCQHWLKWCLILTTERSKDSKSWSTKTGFPSATCSAEGWATTQRKTAKTGRLSSYSFWTVCTRYGTKCHLNLNSTINCCSSSLSTSIHASMAHSSTILSRREVLTKLSTELYRSGWKSIWESTLTLGTRTTETNWWDKKSCLWLITTD